MHQTAYSEQTHTRMVSGPVTTGLLCKTVQKSENCVKTLLKQALTSKYDISCSIPCVWGMDTIYKTFFILMKKKHLLSCSLL